MTSLLSCTRCGFRFYDRGLSEDEAKRYYDGYRNHEYFDARHRFEIFYTSVAHRGTADWLNSTGRKVALADTLARAGAPRRFSAALDFGGGTGHMLLGIDALKKAVFDVSHEPPVEGVVSFGDRQEIGREWDLILSCQVLEHLNDPFGQITEIAQLLLPGGWVYVEVPEQIWTNIGSPQKLHESWLAWLAKNPTALRIADFASTAFRVKLKFLPPFGFAPMREHINYFTAQGLTMLLTRANLTVRWAGKNVEGSLCAVATRS